MQNRNQIVVRLRGASGQYRVNVKKSDTFREMLQEIANVMNSDPETIELSSRGKTVRAGLNTLVGDIREMTHGVMLDVSAIIVEKKQEPEPVEETMEEEQGTLDQQQEVFEKKEASGTGIFQKESNYGKCSHGPNGKCINCMITGKEGHHIAFDFYLQKNNALKNESHKLRTVVLPHEISYKIKEGCPLHDPYPKGMCNKCVPPSIAMKRQKYRHVDYCTFMNSKDINDLVVYWLNNFESRSGFLYGYYAEDPDYELGIRAVVEAIYEPPQQGDYTKSLILRDPYLEQVDMLAESLGMEKIGWIYTCTDHDSIMTPDKIIQAAKYQMENLVQHPSGYEVPKFMTVILRTQKGSQDVLPEVYMMKDATMAMVRDDIFDPVQESKTHIKIRDTDDERLIPSVLLQGKPSKEVPIEFFLVKINHGQPKNNNFAIIKNHDFPKFNRKVPPNRKDLKKYMKKYRNRDSFQRFANFNLMLFIAREMDIHVSPFHQNWILIDRVPFKLRARSPKKNLPVR